MPYKINSSTSSSKRQLGNLGCNGFVIFPRLSSRMLPRADIHISSMAAENVWVHFKSAERFIERCREYFEWTHDLSKDVMLDVGCGLHGFIGKTLHDYFKFVGTIIGITKDPNEANNLREENVLNIDFAVADIEKRESLQDYEGRMTKVLSVHHFQFLADKELAFRNILHLLKPGGEVAVLFVVKSSLHEWVTEMLKEPRWKAAFQGQHVEDLYKNGFSEAERQRILKIGFIEVECWESDRELPHRTDEVCKEDLFGIFGKSFNIPPELVEEFKEQGFQVLLKINGRNNEGKTSWKLKEMTLLLRKPKEGDSSETKDITGS